MPIVANTPVRLAEIQLLCKVISFTRHLLGLSNGIGIGMRSAFVRSEVEATKLNYFKCWLITLAMYLNGSLQVLSTNIDYIIDQPFYVSVTPLYTYITLLTLPIGSTRVFVDYCVKSSLCPSSRKSFSMANFIEIVCERKIRYLFFILHHYFLGFSCI